MGAIIPFIPFFLLVSILPFHATASLITSPPIVCSGSTYAVNSTYQTNLNTLLSTLTAKSSSFLYNNVTVGTSANKIYGHYVCQGDLSPADCQTCVQIAATNVTTIGNCTSSHQAIIWYNDCMLRYSDANFFGVPDTNGCIIDYPGTSSTSLVPYQMVSNLIHVAPFRQPMFASNASTSSDYYTMAQCTDDLSSAGCSQCLNLILSSIKACCVNTTGWTYLAASCSIRYEERAIGNGALAPQLAPQPSLAPQFAPQPLLPNAAGGGKQKSSKKVAVILGPVLGAILLGTLLY